MNCKSVTFVTNLPIWSMAHGVGAPSMYLTIMGYSRTSYTINYFTTEAYLDKEHYKFDKFCSLSKFNMLRMKLPLLRKILKYFNWILLNFLMLMLLFWHRPKGIIYAYEIFFIPAAKVYCLFSNDTKLVTRFQGTILTPLLQSTKMQRLKIYLRKFDHLVALDTPSDLIVMTDDGTQGDQVLKFLKNKSNLLFVKNGIGWPNTYKMRMTKPDEADSVAKFPVLNAGVSYFYTSCRLNSWKRVDRAIHLFKSIHDNYPDSHLFIVGLGPELENLKALVQNIGADSCVTFLGPLSQDVIAEFARKMDFFISLYELSNVGNPLWEAIEAGATIITIANGDTGKYITNLKNGFIQSEREYMLNSENVLRVLKGEFDLPERATIPSDVTSWDVRIKAELDLVLSL